jgi:hypothetical protein
MTVARDVMVRAAGMAKVTRTKATGTQYAQGRGWALKMGTMHGE